MASAIKVLIKVFVVLFALGLIQESFQAPASQGTNCPVMDIALLIDSSGSIGRRNWGKMTTACSNFISTLNISPDGTHVAVIAFSSSPDVVLRFNTYSGENMTAQNIKRDIRKMRLQRGLTFIDKALLMADKDVFTAQNGMRQRSKKVAILVTDGVQTTNRGPVTPFPIAVKGLKAKGVEIFTFGIGKFTSKSELLQVASSEANYLHGKRFTALPRLFSKVKNKLC